MTRPVLGITPARVGYRELKQAMEDQMSERDELLLEVSLSLAANLPRFHEGPFKDGFYTAIEECLYRIEEMRRGSYRQNEDGTLTLIPFRQESPEAATRESAGRDSGDSTPKPRTGHPRPPQSKTAAGAESEATDE